MEGSTKKRREVKSKPKCPRPLCELAKTTINNVYRYFEHLHEVQKAGKLCGCVVCSQLVSASEPVALAPFKATGLATGFKKQVIFDVRKRFLKKPEAANLKDYIPVDATYDTKPSPRVWRKHVRSALCEAVTWSSLILSVCKASGSVSGERLEDALKDALRSMAITLQPWNGETILLEKRSLVQARARYLEDIAKAREETTVAYLDICWFRANRMYYCPDDFESALAGSCKDTNVMSRVFMFAGTTNQEIMYECLFNLSNFKSALLSWASSVFRGLPKRSVVVFADVSWLNGPSVQLPSEVTPRSKIIKWLSKRGVGGLAKDTTRSQLLELVKLHSVKEQKTSSLQALAEEHGHRVLLVPWNAVDLNPVSHIWEDIERGLSAENASQNKTVATATTKTWCLALEYALEIEKSYSILDASVFRALEKLLPNCSPDRDDTLWNS